MHHADPRPRPRAGTRFGQAAQHLLVPVEQILATSRVTLWEQRKEQSPRSGAGAVDW